MSSDLLKAEMAVCYRSYKGERWGSVACGGDRQRSMIIIEDGHDSSNQIKKRHFVQIVTKNIFER